MIFLLLFLLIPFLIYKINRRNDGSFSLLNVIALVFDTTATNTGHKGGLGGLYNNIFYFDIIYFLI